MKISIALTALTVPLFLTSVASNGRFMHLPLELSFDVKYAGKANKYNHNSTVVCALDPSSLKRKGEGNFKLEGIEASLCTQLIYRNNKISKEYIYQIVDHREKAAEYREVTELHREHPDLNVFLSVGGWDEGSSSFSEISADKIKRDIFVKSVKRVLKTYGFQGVDIAWEYPGLPSRGGTPKDKDNLSFLLSDMRTALGEDFMISLTVSGDTNLAKTAYNLKQIVGAVDQINLRAFDFSGSWAKKTGHHAPIHDDSQSVAKSVAYYLTNGVPPEKLVLGIPFYGRTFLLKEGQRDSGQIEVVSGYGQPAAGGFAGGWINNSQLIGYHEICHELADTEKYDWQTFWDNLSLVPFVRNDKRWVTFDNPESVHHKVSFAMMKKLKGVMAWTIDTDDFQGTACRKAETNEENAPRVVYPLLRTINKALAETSWEDKSKVDLPNDAHPSLTVDSTSGMQNMCTKNSGSWTVYWLIFIGINYSLVATGL